MLPIPPLVAWNIYLTDLLDIAITALVLYTLLLFVRRTKIHLVFFGVAFTFGLYILSKTFNLYLTFMTLQYFVGVSLIIFVIIFQAEIRKYFEFLGLMGTRQIKVGPLAPKSLSTSEIIQACVRMAQSKIGALIVIQGKDNLDPYLDGGISLDGIISEDLILSIFDPNSDGHDGALIISNGRISRFGVHLPLSSNFKEIGKHGTRHSAALGLTENSDALCIVSSEEKGQISICKEEKLKTLEQFSDLEKELEKFIKAKFIPENKKWYILRQDSLLKVAAVLSAVIIWFFTAYQAGIVEKTFDIPVTFYNLPENTIVEDYNPKIVQLTVSARGNNIFSDVDDSDFETKLDGSDFENGVNKETLTRKNISIPGKVSLLNFEPETVLLNAKKYYQVNIPVKAKSKGILAKDLELRNIVVTPESIEAWVLENEKPPEEIATEIIDISNQTESVIIPVKLIIPEGLRLLKENTDANVALTIEGKN